MTIIDAVKQVLQGAERPMTPGDVLMEIQRRALYPSKAKDPLGVLRAQMRRHTEGYDRPTAASAPCLKKIGKDLYALL